MNDSRITYPASRCWGWLTLTAVAVLLAGCATSPSTTANPRPFAFDRDTVAFANQLVWEYSFNEEGKWTSRPREPKPDYTHHCFVVARSAKQFFLHARFDAVESKADDETYRRLIREVVSRSPRVRSADSERIAIPGHANLREFSEAHERLLKDECGGAWQSYFQRGHWRMIFPFSRRHQAGTARRLIETLKRNRPAVVHLVRFPSLKINHSVLVFGVAENGSGLRFAAYDPNAPDEPVALTYDQSGRTFQYPANFYFPGGRVDVYEIYQGWCY